MLVNLPEKVLIGLVGIHMMDKSFLRQIETMIAAEANTVQHYLRVDGGTIITVILMTSTGNLLKLGATVYTSPR